MNSFHNYSSIYNMGHKAVKDLLTGPVYVQEKVDGSQFSFGVDEEGVLHVRSKGAVMVVDAPEKMFTKAVGTAKMLKDSLVPGYTYRCEYLAKPKHNTLAYERTPINHLILFDVEIGECDFLPYSGVKAEALRLGLEVVPLLYEGIIDTLEQFRTYLNTISILGGQKIEGVVVKPVGYGIFGIDKKVLMGKFVSEEFKEIHSSSWKERNPKNSDLLAIIAEKYTTPARWNKALQHLREKGAITDSPQDIGMLIKEVPTDILKECENDIKEELFRHAWEHISRKVTHGLPQWYKELLLKAQFEQA